MIVFDIPHRTDEKALHTILLKGLRDRLELCESRRSTFDTRMDKNEERCALYRKKNEKDAKKKTAKNKGESEYSEVVVPYSFALMASAHAYMCSVFLQRDPVFMVQGVQDEGATKELAIETLLRFQYNSGDMGKHMLIWLLDPCRYGIGILGSYWAENDKVVTQLEEHPLVVDGVEVEGKTQKRFVRRVVQGYRGNRVFNVHPKDFIFDPRVPMNAIQDMEFLGRKTSISTTTALERQQMGEYFNIDAVINKMTAAQDKEKAGDVDRVLDDLTGAAKVDHSNAVLKTPVSGKTGQIQLEELSVTLIPKQWGISTEGNRPEKWHFTIANKEFIVCAYPQGTLHQEHGYHVLEMELDGYRQDSRSLTEMAEPMNDVLSWMFNSHMWNRRAALNNQFVYDPMRVNESDLRSTKAGKMIRLKATAMGTDVRTAIHQLPVADVTANSIQDAMAVEKMMQRTLGVNEDVAGTSSTSSRRSATEFQATTGFSMGRLARDALHFSLTGFKSLGRHLISNTQQFYTAEQKLKVGGYTGFVEEVVDVSPEIIAGSFDVVPVDGTMPISRMQEASFWKEVLLGLGQLPDIRAAYRVEDIFAHMARQGGLQAIEKFRVEPDEKVQRLIQMGVLENVTSGLVPGTNTGTPASQGSGAAPVGDAYSALNVPTLPATVATPKP